MSIDIRSFGRLADGTAVECCTLKNNSGMSADFLTYGCRMARLYVPNRDGEPENVVLGHDTISEYERKGDVFGAVVGRFANRIKGAEFKIGGKSYSMPKSEGENALHSSPGGFQNRVWRIKRSNNDSDAPSITFSYRSPDGEGGFPGNVDVSVTYTLSTDNALIIEYEAKSDAETPLNLTNHTYFNITGSPVKDILSLELQVNADAITETDEEQIPTGRLIPVSGTPFDFRKAKTIGQNIRDQHHYLQACGGYDNNFALGFSVGVRNVAELHDAASGRRMLVFTDLPGLQVYTANSFLPYTRGIGGRLLKPHHAVCMETQFYPDSVHRPEFPYKNLKPDKPFHSTTIYKFNLDK
ncbi:MAG TPA: galactose-1-epimerase [Ruminococcaceae bacterium]|jgi:aldose 1-epimerase|nr:galactose-1-epimerase [Oscillospiraceae bacterium]